MTTRIVIAVQFDLPPGATVADCVQYVLNAVQSECGHYPPNEPMHHLDRHSVQVVFRNRIKP
jgi:hypothetical protein